MNSAGTPSDSIDVGAPINPKDARAPVSTSHAYPVNYDVANINAEPVDMQAVARELDEMQKSIAEDLKAIQNRLSSLRLSWSGESAKEREELTDSWIIVMLELYGAPHAAKQGVLPALTGGVLNAAKNLSSAELGVAKAFRGFYHALQSNGHTDPYEQPADELNPRVTAITSEYPMTDLDGWLVMEGDSFR
jgi:uncharacterized protein YukE